MAVTRILYRISGLVFILFSLMNTGAVHGENTDSNTDKSKADEDGYDIVQSPPSNDNIDLTGADTTFDHLVNKRFSGSYDDNDVFDDEGMYEEDMPLYADKRQASRWKYIYQKLYDLDKSKRSPMRWKLIYQKLNNLDNGPSSSQKRFAGRWRQQNWLLNRGGREEPTEQHRLQKRFIGRWKNNNWRLQQKINDRQ